MIIPHSESKMNGYAMYFVKGSRMMEIRIMPYPPNFRRIAARIMEPAMGASTWAFGSLRWTPYRGILMRNAIMHANHRMLLDQVDSRGWTVRDRIRKLRVPIEF